MFFVFFFRVFVFENEVFVCSIFSVLFLKGES